VEFQEDDNLDGTYQPAEEGTYNYRMKVDWLGWKLVSFSYDDTKISTSGGFGNTDRNGKKNWIELAMFSSYYWLSLVLRVLHVLG